jgi:hypothetical protein
VKFHLPSKLKGSPRWHKSHFEDLLAMVAKFGMPHFFLTFTSNQMSSLRWAKNDQLNKLIKKIDVNMTWKDCLIECATIFHSRFEQLVLLVMLKNMLFDMNYNIVVLFMLMSFCGSKKKMLKTLEKKLLHLYLQY